MDLNDIMEALEALDADDPEDTANNEGDTLSFVDPTPSSSEKRLKQSCSQFSTMLAAYKVEYSISPQFICND